MSHTINGARRAIAPLFITQQRKASEFLADQDRIATIKGDWLYQMGSEQVKCRLLTEAGYKPLCATATTPHNSIPA